MLPQSYQKCFQEQLTTAQYLLLKMLIDLMQSHKQVSLEKLATWLPLPILFESRRRALQRFLRRPELKIQQLWFPLVKYLLLNQQPAKQPLLLAIDRTQWQKRNLLMVSWIWQKRAIPIFWQVIAPYRWSLLSEQQELLSPTFDLLQDYKIVVLGDREFGSMGLANWLKQQNVGFCLRQKQGQYVQEKGREFQRLSTLGLAPGISRYLWDLKVTKLKGFNQHDIAASWRRKYRRPAPEQGWYILTNLGSVKAAISAYKARMGIEAMFKDCKSGGYNLEDTHVNDARLTSLVLLIAIAYTTAIIQGSCVQHKGLQKYIGRVTEPRRIPRRHSTFWVGFYAHDWIEGGEVVEAWVSQWLKLHPQKRQNYQRGLRAKELMLSTF